MKIHKAQAGFTLVEVLVAIGLLTISLMGLCGSAVMAMKGNTLSQMSTRATVMAKDRMEGLKNISYSAVSTGYDTPETGYTRVWTVTDNSPVTDTRTIAVNVSWTWLGIAKNVTLSTIITR